MTSERAAQVEGVRKIARQHIRVLMNDDGVWGIDVHGTWMPFDDDREADVREIAEDMIERQTQAFLHLLDQAGEEVLKQAAKDREDLEKLKVRFCSYCQEKWPVDKDGWHHAPEAGHILLPDGPCGAVDRIALVTRLRQAEAEVGRLRKRLAVLFATDEKDAEGEVSLEWGEALNALYTEYRDHPSDPDEEATYAVS